MELRIRSSTSICSLRHISRAGRQNVLEPPDPPIRTLFRARGRSGGHCDRFAGPILAFSQVASGRSSGSLRLPPEVTPNPPVAASTFFPTRLAASPGWHIIQDSFATGAVAQLVRVLDCRSSGCGFESRRPRFFSPEALTTCGASGVLVSATLASAVPRCARRLVAVLAASAFRSLCSVVWILLSRIAHHAITEHQEPYLDRGSGVEFPPMW